MDGISLLEAIAFYSLLLSPLLSMILLLFWTSVNMKNTAKAQLAGIVILSALGFAASNSPLFLLIETAALILSGVWIFAYRGCFLKGQLTVILSAFALQAAYSALLFTFIGSAYSLAVPLLCISPILTMILLYPWTFGNKRTSGGWVFLLIVFFVQVVHAILTITLL